MNLPSPVALACIDDISIRSVSNITDIRIPLISKSDEKQNL